MVMQDYIEIAGIDVTESRLTWNFYSEWDQSIDALDIKLAISVSSLLTPTVGQVIIVKRGFTTSTDEFVFEGQITQVMPETNVFKLVCKNILYDAIKSAQVNSWDKDINTEAGVGSEIFKAICDNSELTYSPAKGVLTDGSIINTGASDQTLIRKFIQNDEDDFQKMNELVNIYNYTITYDYDNSLVNFKPKGYITYPAVLNVGTEIPGQIKWKENMEQMCNKAKIQGATVYDKIPETFAGPATTFTLAKTPEDTEVYINTTTIQTRGQKDVGTIGTDFDYYIDVETKKLVFSGDVSNVVINYGAQVPMDIVIKNVTSIETYGGPNKKPHFKKFKFTDIKDVFDAESRGNAIIAKYGVPFIEAVNIPVIDSVIAENRNFNPGDMVQIIDTFNDKDLTVSIKSVMKSWPHINDEITVGDEIWRTENWQARQMEKIEQLINELNKNQDILIQRIDISRTINLERRYAYGQIKDRSGDGVNTFILGHPTFGILGTQELGDVGTSWATVSLAQGNGIYKEFLYDTVFEGAGLADWDTANKWIDFPVSTLRTNILAYWKFDSGTTDEVAAYTITNNGASVASSGKINGCYTYNGSSDYMEVDNLAAFDFTAKTDRLSISVWFKSTVGGFIFGKDGGSTLDCEYRIRLNSSVIIFEYGSYLNGATYTHNGSLTDGEWHHVVATADLTDMYVYVDGVYRATAALTTTTTFAGKLNIGARNSGEDDTLFTGEIDEFAIWDKTLSDGGSLSIGDTAKGEIASLYGWSVGNQYNFANVYHETALISLGTTHTYFTIDLGDVTGTISVKISGDGGTTWQSVTLNQRTAFTTATTAGVKILVYETAKTIARIENTYKDSGAYDDPVIYCKLEV